MEPKKTPLYDEHVRMGSKMAEFAGWVMPLWYPEGQVLEHHAVRKACGLFDICHMGEFEITGSESLDFLSRILSNAVQNIVDHQAMYHFMLNEHGGVIDDCILYRYDTSRWMLVVNAGNIRTDFDWLLSQAPSGIQLRDISDQTVKLDLQGPNAPKLLATWIPIDDLMDLKFFRFISKVIIEGMDVLVSRTGYTGEVGFELYLNIKHAVDFWNLLLSEGKRYGILPCGLGARDTLRLEAGLPLHGHELKPERIALGHPWEFAISWEHGFIGKEALIASRNRGISCYVQAFVMDGKRKAMAGWDVISENEKVGTVLSGVISPTLQNTPIGFIETDRLFDNDTKLVFLQGSGAVPFGGRIALSPFVPPTSRRKMSDFFNLS